MILVGGRLILRNLHSTQLSHQPAAARRQAGSVATCLSFETIADVRPAQLLPCQPQRGFAATVAHLKCCAACAVPLLEAGA